MDRIRPRRAAATLAVGLLLSSAACTPDLPRFGTLRYQGADFEVWASDGLEACGGTHAYTEGWLAAFRDHIGEHAKPQYHVFNWVDEDDADAAPCSVPGSCAFQKQNVIYARSIPLEHEIVHVELDTDKSPPVFDEGAAEAFGTRRPLLLTSENAIEPALHETVRIGADAYPVAGRFTRYLIETYGLDDYFAVVRSSRDDDGKDGITKAFARHLGEPLDDVLEDFESYASCATPAWRYFDYECSALPPTPWATPDRWEASLELDCANETTIGSTDGRARTMVALDVPQTGDYTISGGSDQGALIYLVPCDISCFEAGPEPFGFVRVGNWPLRLVQGRYWLRAELDADEAASISITIDRVGQ